MNSPTRSRPPSGLARRSLAALRWNALGTLVKVLSQFAVGIALARLLGPEPFGLVAVAWLMLGLGNLVADFGLAAALIQQPTLQRRDVRCVFTLQMATGLGLAALTALAAPLVARLYGSPAATDVLRWMSLGFVLQAAGLTASALLRRDLRHRTVQLLQVGSYLLAYLGLGLPLAFHGAGVWSLVCAQLAQAGCYALGALLAVRHPMLPTLHAETPGLLGFGGKVTASNLSSWAYVSLDTAIVGATLGVTPLGVYNRAMALIASPVYAGVSALQAVLFPLYARLQGDEVAVRRTYLGSLCLSSLVLMPVCAALAALPGTLIDAVYGAAWTAATPLVTPLALAMPFYAVMAMGGPMMLGLGRAGREALAQTLCATLLVVALLLASSHSLAAVAWSVLAVFGLRALLITRLALQLCGASRRQALQALVGPLLLALLAATAAQLSEAALHDLLPQPGWRLGACLLVVGTCVTGAVAWAGRHLLCAPAHALLVQTHPHLPRTLQRWLGRTGHASMPQPSPATPFAWADAPSSEGRS